MRRVVGWAVFVAALVALGALIHAAAGPTRRWSVRLEVDEKRPLPQVRFVPGQPRWMYWQDRVPVTGSKHVESDAFAHWMYASAFQGGSRLSGPIDARDVE